MSDIFTDRKKGNYKVRLRKQDENKPWSPNEILTLYFLAVDEVFK